MSTQGLGRAVLAVTVGLGVAAGLARGQMMAPPTAAPVIVNSGAPLQPVPTSSYESYGAAAGEAGCSSCQNRSHSHLFNWLHDHQPCGCWSHHNSAGCGSLLSETKFIFGSCRTFFGEPCQKGPPASPIPPPGAQISPPISVAPGYAPAASGLAPFTYPPGMPVPAGGGPTTIVPGQGMPRMSFDYSSVPSARLPASQAAPVSGENYAFRSGGYR